MPTTRRVPDPYTTIQAAYDAADIGDTILLEPGSYDGLIMTKAVNIVGNTTDPCSRPVILGKYPGTAYGSVYLKIASWGAYDSVLIEGITPDYYGVSFLLSFEQDETRMVVVNRCNLTRTNPVKLVDGGSRSGKMRFSNCTSAGASDFYKWVSPSELYVDKCEFVGFATTNSSIGVFSYDYVSTPTEDYGCAYGEFLRDQYMETPYHISGRFNLTNTTPESVQLRLFRETTTGMEPAAWSTTNPDVDGDWAFKYLPTTYKYYVAIIPPNGYRPELIGPYDPEQA